jgi:hypothetical protein
MVRCSTKLEAELSKHVCDLTLLSWGDRILAGEYLRHSRFRQAVNFSHDDNLLSIVTPEVGGGPLNVVLSDIADVETDHVIFRNDSVQIGETSFALNADCFYSSAIGIPADFQPAFFHSRLALFKWFLRTNAPSDSLCFLFDEHEQPSTASIFDVALAARFRNGCRLLKESQWLEGVQLVKGLGRGLTPSGDDFICGLLVALHLRRALFGQDTFDLCERVFHAAVSNNPFSTAYLRCAKDGRVFDKLKQTLLSVFSSDDAVLAADIQRLVRVGGTTGIDLAVGLIFGLETSPAIL